MPTTVEVAADSIHVELERLFRRAQVAGDANRNGVFHQAAAHIRQAQDALLAVMDDEARRAAVECYAHLEPTA
jgi:hypothetical protein